MVFSRYSIVLLRQVKNSIELLQASQISATKQSRKTFILAESNVSKSYSTLRATESGIDKIGGSVPNLETKEEPDASFVSQLKALDPNFENSDTLFDLPEKRPGVFDTCVDDLSHITPEFPVSFNFAAYADKSPMIQKLAELGVDFSKLEKKNNVAQYLLRLDFETDMKYHIRFLSDCGVPADKLGEYLTKNPFIFREDLDNLHTRIRYLRAHKFTSSMIARIVSSNPFWVMFSTKRIDNRLGFFQKEFKLSGEQIRAVTTRQPRLITYKLGHVKENTFSIREEMGFNEEEVKMILLDKPKIWMKSRQFILDSFDYAHNVMNLPHEIITKQPGILLCRLHRMKERHMFLVTQNRAQYDPTKPMYVSPLTLLSNTDSEFCMNVAKTPLEVYNMFLKTL